MLLSSQLSPYIDQIYARLDFIAWQNHLAILAWRKINFSLYLIQTYREQVIHIAHRCIDRISGADLDINIHVQFGSHGCDTHYYATPCRMYVTSLGQREPPGSDGYSYRARGIHMLGVCIIA
jgi:hypothetical protein